METHGHGQGMVAIVRALQDAGLTVTLSGSRHEHTASRNGLGAPLRWNEAITRAVNSQTDACGRYSPGAPTHDGRSINSYQLAHCSKSSGSPLNRHLEGSPRRFRHNNDSYDVEGASRDTITQTPARDAAVTNRRSAYWSQRGIPATPRSSRGTDAFMESLRKYPRVSPERSTSADIIQRLLSHTQNKHLIKNSGNSKSLRSLRNSEPCRDVNNNVHKKKSTKNIQTYCRKESTTRDTSPTNHEIRFSYDRKMNLHSPRSDSLRFKENTMSATYDYLKALSPRFSPSRSTEVRYLQDVSKYVRDTLRQICDDEPKTCPKIASRYSQHKRECLKKSGQQQSSSDSVNMKIQTSPMASREASTASQDLYTCCRKTATRYNRHKKEYVKKSGQPQSSSDSVNMQIQTSPMTSREASTASQDIDKDKTQTVSKICSFCHQTLPCPCEKPCLTLRKLRFKNSDPCPRCCPLGPSQDECPEEEPCPCPDPDYDEVKEKIQEQVEEWLKEIPVSASSSPSEKKKRKIVIDDLVEKLMKLRDVDDYKNPMRRDILECLENLPMWLPSGKRDQDILKNELTDNLMINRLRDLFEKSNEFENVIAKWVDELNFDENSKPVDREKVVQSFIDKLKPLDSNKTDNDLFRDDAKDIILKMLEKLPLEIQGNKKNFYDKMSSKLADALAGLLNSETEEKDKFNKLIHDRLKEDEDGKLKESDDKLTDGFRKNKYYELLNEIPELAAYDSITELENDKISKELAEKIMKIPSEDLDDENVRDELLGDINEKLKDTLKKRGQHMDPRATKKIAEHLLNNLVGAVKKSKAGKEDPLEEKLREKVFEFLDDVPELAAEDSITKRGNDKISKEIAKKILKIQPEYLNDDNVRDHLLEDIEEKLKDTLKKRGQHMDPRATKKLAEHLLNNLVGAVKKSKAGKEDPLEEKLREKVLEFLDDVPELAAEDSITKRGNDKISKEIAKKILEIQPEYLDDDNVRDHLLKDIEEKLKDTLKTRGQHMDPRATKKLAEHLLNNLVGAVKKSKAGKEDLLEEKLREKVLEFLDDVPELAAEDSITKRGNDKISKEIAKQILEIQPEYLDDDNVRDHLLEDIEEKLKDTLKKRGQHMDPRATKKLAEHLLNDLVGAVKKSKARKEDPLEEKLRKKVLEFLDDVPELAAEDSITKRGNDKISKEIAKKILEIQPEYLDDDNVRDHLLEDIEEKLKDTLKTRGQHMDPRATKKLAEHLLNNLVGAVKKSKAGKEDPLEEKLREKVLEFLDDVPELAAEDSITKRGNDKISKEIAKKILEIQPEYLDDDNVRDHLLEDIEEKLKDTLKKRGQHMDPRATKKLAEHLLNNLVGAVKKSKAGKEDPLEEKLREKVLEFLDDVPELAAEDSITKRGNDKISKDIAKKILEIQPEYLDDDNVRDHLLKDIEEKLKDTLKTRGQHMDPRATKKLAEHLLNNLVGAVKKSKAGKEDPLEEKLREKVLEFLDDVPELAAEDSITKRGNDKISKEIAKKILEIQPEYLDDDNVRDHLLKDIEEKLKDTLKTRGQHMDPRATKKLAEHLLNNLVGAVKKSKAGKEDPLEEKLREKVLEFLDDVPELAAEDSITKRENDKISKEIAKKILEIQPEYLDDDNVRDHLLEDIEEKLKDTLKKRGQHMDPRATKKLAEHLLNNLVGAVKKSKAGKEDPLEEKLREKVLEFLDDVPELAAEDSITKRGNDKISKEIAKKILEIQPEYLDDDNVRDHLLKDIEEKLKDTLKTRGQHMDPRATKKLAEHLLNNLVGAVKKSKAGKEDPLEEKLREKVLEFLDDVPELAAEDSITKRGNDKISKEIAKKILEIQPEYLDDDSVRDHLLKDIEEKLKDTLKTRGQHMDPRATKKLAEHLLNNLVGAVKKSKAGKEDPLEEKLREKVLEFLDDVPELAAEDSITKRGNDKISKEIAKKILEIQPEYLDDDNVRDHLLEDIEEKLKDTLKKRSQHMDPRATKKLAEHLLNNLVGAVKKSKAGKEDPLEKKLREKVVQFLDEVPELAAEDSITKRGNDKISKEIAKKILEIQPEYLDDENVRNHLLKDIEEKLKDTLKKRGQHMDPKATKKLAEHLLNNLVGAVKKSKTSKGLVKKNHDDDGPELAAEDTITERENEQKSKKMELKLANDLKKKILDWLNTIPELAGDGPSNRKDNENFSKDLAKKVSQLIPRLLEDDNVKEQLLENVEDRLKTTLNKRSYVKEPKAIKKLATDLVNELVAVPTKARTEESDEEPRSSGDDYRDNKKPRSAGTEPKMASSSAESAGRDIQDQVWSWFKDIPELSVGDNAENKKCVNKLSDKLQKIQDEGGNRQKMQKEISNWMSDIAQQKGVKLNNKEKDKLKNKLMNAINSMPKLKADELVAVPTKARTEESEEEPRSSGDDYRDNKKPRSAGTEPKMASSSAESAGRDIQDQVWSWFKDIPELSDGDNAENKKCVSKLSDKLQKIQDEGGNKQKMQKEIGNWLSDIAQQKGVKLNNKEKDKLKNKLMNAINSMPKLKADELEEKVWDWFKDIPGISAGDDPENNELVNALTNKLKRFNLSDNSGKNKQKIKDEIGNWLDDLSKQNGVKLNKKDKEILINKLFEALKCMPVQKSANILPDDGREKSSGPVWNWFKNIPELSDDNKPENNSLVNKLDTKLKKLVGQNKDGIAEEDLGDEIDDWLEDVAERKGIKINSKKRRELRNKLLNTLRPKLNQTKEKSKEDESDDDIIVWDWFLDIPEISGGDTAKNKKLVDKLYTKLKKVHNDDVDEDHEKHKRQGIIDNWLQDVSVIKGEKLNTRIKENLRNKLMDAFSKSERRKSQKHGNNQHTDDNGHDKSTGVWVWFTNIPEISSGDKTENKKLVDKLANQIQTIEDSGDDEEITKIKLQKNIDNWLRNRCKKKGVQCSKMEIENYRDLLIDSMNKDSMNKQGKNSVSNDDVIKDKKQNIWDWFKRTSRVNDGKIAENNTFVEELAKDIDKVRKQGDGKENMYLNDIIDDWLKALSRKKSVRFKPEEVDDLKERFISHKKSKPKDKEQQQNKSANNDYEPDQTLKETDDDMFENTAQKTKRKNDVTDKSINKHNINKTALKGFSNATSDKHVDNKIKKWLDNIPEIKLDTNEENNIIETLATKLKNAKNTDTEKELKKDIKNWLDDLFKKKKGRKLDDRTKENFVNQLLDSVKSIQKPNKEENAATRQTIGVSGKKGRRHIEGGLSPDKSTTSSYGGSKESRELDTKKLAKTMPHEDNDDEKSSSSKGSRDRKRWSKERKTQPYDDYSFHKDSKESRSPTRSTSSQENKFDIDTIKSDNEESTSITSKRMTPSYSPRSESYESKQHYKSLKKPTPDKELREQIMEQVVAGLKPEAQSESRSYQSKNRRKSRSPGTESQTSKGSNGSKSPSNLPSVLKRTESKHSNPSLTPSEIFVRNNPRLRARSDAASMKLVQKSLKDKPKSALQTANDPKNKTREIFYVEESSDSNGWNSRRKSVATQRPIARNDKRSGEEQDDSKKGSKTLGQTTKDKISESIEKNMDTITSPNYADAEEEIMEILIEDGLPESNVRALAKVIIKKARTENGIIDSEDEDSVKPQETEDEDDDGNVDNDDKNANRSSVDQAKKLVKNVLDEFNHFTDDDTDKRVQVEDGLVKLIADQLDQGDIDDETKDAMLSLLSTEKIPESIADEICETIIRRARVRPMSFSQYPQMPPARNTIGSALTLSQKQAFIENAGKEITDFYDELTGPVSPKSRTFIDEVIQDTVKTLADILDNPDYSSQQKKDMMRHELVGYLRKIPITSNVPEEELADQLMERVQNVRFISSTPQQSQTESFFPKRDNPEPSLSTIFDENENLDAEQQFKDQLVDAIHKWSNDVNSIKDKVGFKDTMAKDLADEIIDRQKYLQVNPQAKSTPEEELEHSKYIVFRWLNKMVDLKDLTNSVNQIDDLVDIVHDIPVPNLAEQQGSLWALSRSSNYDPLETDITEWLEQIPSDLHASNLPELEELQVKQFVDLVNQYKGKPNVETNVEKEMKKWLPKMFKTLDEPTLDTFKKQLKTILTNNGYVNPRLEKLTGALEEKPEPSQKPDTSSQTTDPSQAGRIPPQQQAMPPQSQSQPSQIPAQDRHVFIGNQQNPMIIPNNENIASKVNEWANNLPILVTNPQEQKNVDNSKLNLISQLKQLRQQYPTTSNEYDRLQRDAIKGFMQNVPLDPEKKQNEQYLADKTDELMRNLGTVPTDTIHDDKGVQREFKKATDLLYDTIEKWCKDLPIYSESPTEDPEKNNALKQNLVSKLLYKIGELNMNPDILNDDFLYEDLLLDEVDRQLKDVPKNPELEKYLPALEMELAAKVKEARQKIRDELAGQAYKQQLRDTISLSVCLPDNLSPDEQASFEILKDNLADAFINLHYVPDNEVEGMKFKKRINDEVNRFCNEFLQRHPRVPIDRKTLTKDLYLALLNVPVPKDESMVCEIEQARIKDLINDWMKELPLKEETLTEQLQRNKKASLLAKRLHELEREKEANQNSDSENEMFKEISKWLRKQQLRPGQEVYIPEFADRLRNKLNSTEYSRRFDSSGKPPAAPEPSLFCIGRLPPCTLSREDRAHLQRIRDRNRSPCSSDAKVCPRMNSYSQTEVRPQYIDHTSSWCRKEFCPGKTQTPTQMPGSYCSMHRPSKRDASCTTTSPTPYEVSPHVIVKEYYWETPDGCKQQTSFQQTQPPCQVQQPPPCYQIQQPGYQTPQQGYQTSQQGYQTPQQGYQTPQQSYQTPQQSYSPQDQPHTPQNNVSPTPQQFMTPQESTSSAYRQPTEEIPFVPSQNRPNIRFGRPCHRTPDASSGEDIYPGPGTSRSFRRARVTRLGSLDDISCQRPWRRPTGKNSRSRICDDESEWSSVRFPEDREFWDFPRHRVFMGPAPFVQERERRQEKIRCKCKERVSTSCQGRSGRSYREYDTRHCGIHCPYPSYMFFR